MSDALEHVRYSCGIAGEEVANYVDQLQAKVAELEKDLLKTKLDLLTSYGESEELLGRIAELEAENARWKNSFERTAENTKSLLEQLAASQAHAEQLREAIEDAVDRLRNTENWLWEDLAQALALPRDTSALDAWVADKLAAEQLNNKLLRDALKMVTNKVCWSVFTDSEETQIEESLAQPSDTSALDAYVDEKVKEKTDALHYRMEHCYSIDHVKIQCELDKITKQRDLAVEALDKISDPWIYSVPAIAEFARKVASVIKESDGK